MAYRSPAAAMEDYGKLHSNVTGPRTGQPVKPRHNYDLEPLNELKAKTINFQKEMRQRPTNSERRVKSALLEIFGFPQNTKRKKYRDRFIDQKILLTPTGSRNCIADFYIPASKVVIEVDGRYHDTPAQKRSDANREYRLRKRGIKTYRITNEQTLNHAALVEILKPLIYGPDIKRPVVNPPRKQQAVPPDAVKVQPGVYVRFK